MDNTQKKKKKINIPLLLMTIGFISFIGYFGYEYIYKPLNSVKDGESGNEILQKLEDGTVYVYSEEEKEEFKKIAAEYREFKVKQKNLKPGDGIYAIPFEKMSEYYKDDGVTEIYPGIDEYQIHSFLYFDDLKQPYNASDERVDLSEKYYDSNIVKPGNLFSENLKLKQPEIFCGFTSVSKPTFDRGVYVGDTGFDFHGRSSNSEKIFKSYVKMLKNIDRDYKDNTDLNSKLNDIVKRNPNAIFSFNPVLNISKNEESGSVFIHSVDYNNEEKHNSVNPLQRFLKYKPRKFTNIGDVVSREFNDDLETTDVDLFPQNYNYFIDKENYYIDFVPSKVTKYDEKTYLVDIEVDKPLDQKALGIIVNLFHHRFYHKLGLEGNVGKLMSEVNLNLSVRVTYKNISNGMLNEYGIFTVTPKGSIVNDGGKEVDNSSLWFYEDFLNWYPNEEAQAWVREYFTLAKEAFDNDSRFSMFETMHQLADKYGVSHKTMESVICSYYFTMLARN